MRIGGERVFRDNYEMGYTVPPGFAGSILNLEPGTRYECEFTMQDPDGVQGEATQRVTVATRTEPQPYQGGRVLHVYPDDWVGEGGAEFHRAQARPTMAPAAATGPPSA
ncbi:MAG: hypothetical protein R2748_05425 [Bryobacterales bacterium]